MRIYNLILGLFVLLCSVSASAQRATIRIGYIDMEYILENVDDYQQANAQLEQKVQRWKREIDQKKAAIEELRKNLNSEKPLLTKELISEREEEIKILEDEMTQYQQDRFGPNGDLVLQRNQLVKPIQDKVFNAIQEIGAAKRYDFIFDRSADVVMLYSAKKYDISELVLRSINKGERREEIIQRQQQKIQPVDTQEEGVSQEQLLDLTVGEEELNEDITSGEMLDPNDPDYVEQEETQQLTREELEAQRLQEIEQKREERLRQREEAKKAYEERRLKLLEEREARKKAKLEEQNQVIQEQNLEVVDSIPSPKGQ